MRLSIGLVSVALCFVMFACNRSHVVGVALDSQLKGFILPNSKALAGINLDKLKQTDFFRRHQAQLILPQLDQLPAQIGMDPRKDLSSFLMAWDGDSALVMTKGSYTPDQLQKRLGGVTQSEKFNSFTLFGDGKRDVVFLPKGLALIGSSSELKKAINNRAAGGGGLLEDLQLQLSRVNAGAQVWEVSTGPIPLAQMPVKSDTASAISNIANYVNATSMGLTFSTGAALDAHISCISDEGAKRVNDALKGAIGLARLSTPDSQLDQLKLWDSIHVEKQDKEVHISADLTPEMADKLMGILPTLTRVAR